MKYLSLIFALGSCGPWVVGDPFLHSIDAPPVSADVRIDRCPISDDDPEFVNDCGVIQQEIEDVDLEAIRDESRENGQIQRRRR